MEEQEDREKYVGTDSESDSRSRYILSSGSDSNISSSNSPSKFLLSSFSSCPKIRRDGVAAHLRIKEGWKCDMHINGGWDGNVRKH